MKVTACLLSWKRPEGIEILVNSLKSFNFIDEIIIWNNNSNFRFKNISGDVKIINSDKNIITYGRYKAADLSKNHLIYTQDDDWLPNDLGALLKEYERHEEDIVAYTPHTHYNNLDRTKFVGWGSLFNKKCLESFSKYVDYYGEDFILQRECDLYFTNTNSYRKLLENCVEITKEDHRSLSLQKDHYNYHNIMLNRVKELSRER
jgi:hypothetical protein